MKKESWAAALGVAAFAWLFSAGAATAAMTADQVRGQVERESGGKVIKVEPRQFGAIKAFAVTVMAPGGNVNGAFEIYTVVVDAENGTLVPEQRQAGYY